MKVRPIRHRLGPEVATEKAPMYARRTTWLAWSLSLLCMLLAASSILFGALNGITPYTMLTKEQGLFTVATLVVAFALVGAPLAAHRPRNPIGWICCGAALFQGLNIFSEGYSRYVLLTAPGALPGGALVAWLAQWIWAPGLGLFLVFLPLLFPTGRPPSRRWRWVAWLAGTALALLIVSAAILLWPLRGPALVDFNGPPPGPPWLIGLYNVGSALLLLAGLAAVVSLVMRFRRALGDERQQLKWFVFAAALTFTAVVATIGRSGIHSPLLKVAVAVLGLLIIPSLPVAVGIAILRYRLWDIDVLINRTLVYGVLTAALALVYLGSVVLLQGLLRGLTGQRSDLAVVAATLLVAVLFRPLRQCLQAGIDRRFYRRKYDAAQTLAAFCARLRDEVDLDAVTADLLAVVDDTVQPEHVALWLREPEREP
jgi:hypothetical protein